jgi:hypothetical protein
MVRNCLCQIGKLKSALDEKEREAAQLRDVTNSITSDKRNARARSPLTTGLRFKPEARQDSSVDTCTSEVLSFKTTLKSHAFFPFVFKFCSNAQCLSLEMA